jgi:hypothetical protein
MKKESDMNTELAGLTGKLDDPNYDSNVQFVTHGEIMAAVRDTALSAKQKPGHGFILAGSEPEIRKMMRIELLAQLASDWSSVESGEEDGIWKIRLYNGSNIQVREAFPVEE